MIDELFFNSKEILLAKALEKYLLKNQSPVDIIKDYSSHEFMAKMNLILKNYSGISIKNILVNLKALINLQAGYKTLRIFINPNSELNLDVIVEKLRGQIENEKYLIDVIKSDKLHKNDYFAEYDEKFLIDTAGYLKYQLKQKIYKSLNKY